MKGTVHYRKEGDVAILTVDNPPVNPLSAGVRQGLNDNVRQALQDDGVVGIVLTGAGRAFIAGADISEFGGASEGPGLHEVLREMEVSSKPIVAAINGVALGGGLEVALCCNYRVGCDATQVGLPEVNLGLLPGGGGTQRLPRLVGAEAAIQFMLSAQHIAAKDALALGILDEVAEGDVVSSAIALARKHAGGELQVVRNMTGSLDSDRERKDEILSKAYALAEKTRREQFAPTQIIKCVEAALTVDDFDEGLKREGELFVECLQHPQREAMIHVFFSERQVARIPDVDKSTPVHSVHQAAVIGAGTMGGGIAMNFANAGIPVILVEQDKDNLERGVGVIRKNYEIQVKRGRMSQQALDRCMSLITPTVNNQDIANADLVVEAVYENLELKCEIFAELDKICKPETILASNTSYLNIDAMAEATSRPSQVCGMHFFSPANVMRLLEVVRGEASSPSTLATAMAVGRKMRKVAVLAGNCDGFIGNRMLSGYTGQGTRIMYEGAMPWQIDKALYEFGMPMGIMQMSDLVGLDLGWRARKMAGGSNNPMTTVVDELCERGDFGQKTGKGFYIYDPETRERKPNPEVEQIIKEASEKLGITRRDFTDEEIVKRCIYPLINEGAKVLEEGIALRALDIDIVYINGYGFPVWRGGPMHYANSIGLDKVLADMRELHAEYGSTYEPAPLLVKLGESGGKFE